jgi:competence protein ComEA
MLRKLLLAMVLLMATMGLAWAQADVNKADQAGLEGVQGIGPSLSKKILDARKMGGNFKDWNDLEGRVAGIKNKSAARLSKAGLTVDGNSRPDAPPVAKAVKAEAKPGKMAGKETKPEARQ